MWLILAVLLLAIALGAGGFAVEALWYVAAAVLIIWLLGFVIRPAGGKRWYRW
ncbi:hydrophobic protein [Amycolatopsis suaedae]|uniref:Hydrophobic protein n=1 Tax=Amycolatopsis suaedae TaxID=2510978 RepID=A0A4Q7JBM4_9PSEU|nr:hydrophobic protein [Amycolatopsis suaedae]RZQ64426.1 hydrophobic protein [Amycolatopsis suaedae]